MSIYETYETSHEIILNKIKSEFKPSNYLFLYDIVNNRKIFHFSVVKITRKYQKSVYSLLETSIDKERTMKRTLLLQNKLKWKVMDPGPVDISIHLLKIRENLLGLS